VIAHDWRRSLGAIALSRQDALLSKLTERVVDRFRGRQAHAGAAIAAVGGAEAETGNAACGKPAPGRVPDGRPDARPSSRIDRRSGCAFARPVSGRP
jgi:hypothetical protein